MVAVTKRAPVDGQGGDRQVARNVTAPGVLGKAVEVGAVPAAASVSGKGDACWEVGELNYRLWVWKDAAGALTWDLHIADAKFDALMSEYGGLSVLVRDSRFAIRATLCRGRLLRMPRWPASLKRDQGKRDSS